MKKKCSKCRKALEVLGLLIIGGNLFLIGLIIFWLIQTPRVSVVEQPIRILNENHEIAIGEPIVMELKVDKPINPDKVESNSVSITCTDGNLITLDSVIRVLPDGKNKIVNDDYLLPPKALTGQDCVFNFVITYHQNPIKDTTLRWISEPFTVIER